MEETAGSFGEPVRRQALAEHVAQRLLSLIQTGVLKPGQKLPTERELAGNLGVSRPSLREALRALALLGIIDKRQGDGVFVSTLDPEAMLAPLHFFISLEPHHIDALFEARIFIEAGIAGLAAERISQQAVEQIRSCVFKGESNLNNPEEFLESDIDFHKIIAQEAGNPFLERVAQSFHILGKTSREITVQIPGIREQAHADHKQVLEALSGHDPHAARNAMQQHLQNVQRLYHQYRGDRKEG